MNNETSLNPHSFGYVVYGWDLGCRTECPVLKDFHEILTPADGNKGYYFSDYSLTSNSQRSWLGFNLFKITEPTSIRILDIMAHLGDSLHSDFSSELLAARDEFVKDLKDAVANDPQDNLWSHYNQGCEVGLYGKTPDDLIESLYKKPSLFVLWH